MWAEFSICVCLGKQDCQEFKEKGKWSQKEKKAKTGEKDLRIQEGANAGEKNEWIDDLTPQKGDCKFDEERRWENRSEKGENCNMARWKEK